MRLWQDLILSNNMCDFERLSLQKRLQDLLWKDIESINNDIYCCEKAIVTLWFRESPCLWSSVAKFIWTRTVPLRAKFCLGRTKPQMPFQSGYASICTCDQGVTAAQDFPVGPFLTGFELEKDCHQWYMSIIVTWLGL